jgi:hypothetical protein
MFADGSDPGCGSDDDRDSISSFSTAGNNNYSAEHNYSDLDLSGHEQVEGDELEEGEGSDEDDDEGDEDSDENVPEKSAQRMLAFLNDPLKGGKGYDKEDEIGPFCIPWRTQRENLLHSRRHESESKEEVRRFIGQLLTKDQLRQKCEKELAEPEFQQFEHTYGYLPTGIRLEYVRQRIKERKDRELEKGNVRLCVDACVCCYSALYY